MQINESLIYTGENFNLVADTKENAEKVFGIVKKVLTDGNYVSELENLEFCAENNKVSVADGGIGSADSVITEICKAVADAIADGSFYGHAFYDDDRCGYESCADYQYENGVLIITTVESENGDGYCPECGEQIACFDEFEREKTYYCEDCDCELTAEDMFDGVLPVTETQIFKIK